MSLYVYYLVFANLLLSLILSFEILLTELMFVYQGVEAVSVTKQNTLVVSEIAAACEKSHRENRPVQLTGMAR